MPDPNDTMQILDKLRKLRIATPRDEAFKAHLDRLLCRDEAGNLTHEPQRFSAGRETRGVMVIDGPGGRKDHPDRPRPRAPPGPGRVRGAALP